jgi:hypothetical protein
MLLALAALAQTGQLGIRQPIKHSHNTLTRECRNQAELADSACPNARACVRRLLGIHVIILSQVGKIYKG